ncbi:MAG: gliding motility lipoprotein GldD [Bacteroidales bacterium]|nr:gliding motility lipoprotein GldD [Bacteroidales bacterium]MDD4602912.1 gliding motility lipoprotein GldD [Bacteroidales bacterium]
MKKLFFCISLLFLTVACGSDYVPKPRGYFRIDLPEKQYQSFDSTFPFQFEYPVYAAIEPDVSKLAEPYWINLKFDRFHATLHLSYKVIHGNLPKYLEDARIMVNKHIPKANAILQHEYADSANHVYGLVYEIKGSDAASTYQFYVTDSVSKFVRGALYFNQVPNNDSLAPVIDFIKADIDHLISAFRWKKLNATVDHR